MRGRGEGDGEEKGEGPGQVGVVVVLLLLCSTCCSTMVVRRSGTLSFLFLASRLQFEA